MTSIFDYFEEFKKFYDNKISFTKGILIDNLDSEINLIKTNDLKLIENLHDLNLKKNLKESNKNKLVFDGDYFKLSIFEYDENYNSYNNPINLNMINKYYLFYNNNGFNSGIAGIILNLDVPEIKLNKFKETFKINDFFVKNKMYSFQFTEKFHDTVLFEDLNDKDKINVFIQLLHNVQNLYNIYDDLILNFKNINQIQIYKLDEEITYIYNSTKKYKSKYIVKLLDLSTSQINNDKNFRNKNINIKKEDDIKNLIKLFDIPEYKNYTDINSILNNYLKYDFEDPGTNLNTKDLEKTHFRTLLNNQVFKGKRFIGGAKQKNSKKKNSKTKTSKKKTKSSTKKNKTSKKTKRSKKLNKSDNNSSYNEVSLNKIKDKYISDKSDDSDNSVDIKNNFMNDDFSLEDSDESNKNDKYSKFVNDDFSLEDSDESNKKNKKIISDDSENIMDDDDISLDDDEDSVLSKNNKQSNISDETDNYIMDKMSSELDVLQPNQNNNYKGHSNFKGNSMSKLFNTNPNTLMHPNSVNQQPYNNQFTYSDEMSQMSEPNEHMYNQNINQQNPNMMQNNMQYPNMMQNNMQYHNMMQNNMQYPNMMQNNMQYPNMMQNNMIDPSLIQNMNDPNLMQYNNMVNPNLMQNNNMIDPSLMQNNIQYPNNEDDILSPTMLKNQMGYNNFSIPPQYAVANQYLNQANHLNAPINGLVGGAKKKKHKHKKMKEVRD